MKMSDAFRDLILPSRCICCQSLGKDICDKCSGILQFRAIQTYVGSLPVYSSLRYGPEASRILLASKEDHVRRADELLTNALGKSLRMAISRHRVRPVLVPVPHSGRAIRKRGRNFVAELTTHVARAESLPVRLIVEHNRSVRDQSELNAQSRKVNLSGSMSVLNRSGRPCEVFLVDDLVTTGATLGEAVRSLEEANFRVVAAVTALVALPLR